MAGMRVLTSREHLQESASDPLGRRAVSVRRCWNWRARWGYLEFVPCVHLVAMLVGWFVALGAVLPQSGNSPTAGPRR